MHEDVENGTLLGSQAIIYILLPDGSGRMGLSADFDSHPLTCMEAALRHDPAASELPHYI